MQDFLLLFIGGEEKLEELSPADMQANMERWGGWIGKMSEAGIFKGGNPLESDAKTVAGTDKVVTDGPFAESKEVVGGYVLISAPDMETAVAEARNCPIFDHGGRVEVRPIKQMGC